jgi:PTS system nitrogen regulatory IIA component
MERELLMNNEILTIEDIAKFLRVSERTVYEWAQKGEIPGGKLGTSWRFQRSEILNWLNRRLGGAASASAPPSLSMKSILSDDRCILLSHHTKVEALHEVIDILVQAASISNKDELAAEIFRREQLMSTGIGLGIGLPHVRLNSVSDITMAMGISSRPIEDYESLDGEPVEIIVMVAAPKHFHEHYIRLLAHISSRLKDSDTRAHLIAASDASQVYQTMIGE